MAFYKTAGANHAEIISPQFITEIDIVNSGGGIRTPDTRIMIPLL